MCTAYIMKKKHTLLYFIYSMAVEALRQLGNCTLYSSHNTLIETKPPHDLPLLPCTSCDLQFKTTSDLNNHLIICEGSLHKCTFCCEIFDRKIDLINHTLCHSSNKPYSCKKCNMLFLTKKNLLHHLATHGDATANENTCQICNLTFSRSSSLTNHMKIHNYLPGRAVISNLSKVTDSGAQLAEVLSGTVNLNVEKTEKSKKNVTQTLPSINSWNLYSGLNLTVSQHADVKDHCKTKTHYEGKTKNKRLHKCLYCNKQFVREKALFTHLKIHTSSGSTYQCDVCELTFTDEASLSKHLTVCGISDTNSLDAIKEPYLVTNNNLVGNVMPKGKVSQHSCAECDKAFSTKQKLFRHMWIHRKRTHTCETCSLSFDKQEDLDLHRLNSHVGSSPYICTECGKCFSSRQGNNEHFKVYYFYIL